MVNAVKHSEEIELFQEAGVNIIRFQDVVCEMERTTSLIEAAAGGDLLNLMQLRLGKKRSGEI